MTLIGRSAYFAALFCLVGLGFATQSEAARFQQYKNGTCPVPGTVCTIDFKVVPAAKVLEISDASCYLRGKGGTTIFATQLLQVAPNGNVLNALTLQPVVGNVVSTSPTEAVWQVNEPIFMFANANQHIRAYVEIRGGSFSQFACHISGHIVAP